MKQKRFKRPQIDPGLPCPCEGGKIAQACCLGFDGSIRKTVPNLRPPPPKTCFEQDGCYLAHTGDCSQGLSAEHYVSRTVLEEIGEQIVQVDGPFWLAPGEHKIIGINNLTARILCERHNSALSHLDDEAGAFFRHIKRIDEDASRKSLSRKTTVWIGSGENLERWILKLACGLFYSKIASIERQQIAKDHTVDEQIIAKAMFSGRWYQHCGLYINALVGSSALGINSISIAPVVASNEKRYVGAEITMRGLRFAVIFDPRGANPQQMRKEGWQFRPTDLIFRIPPRTYWIALTWPPGAPTAAVELSYRGKRTIL